FQKAESDLDYIQHKLEFEIMKSLPGDSPTKENAFTVLQELSVVKSRYKALCMRLDKIFAERREYVKGICAAVENTMKIVQTLQQRCGLE
ncbi:SKA2 protein, partial [Syrrhaptes paradoxus]|nr:SKA2 protein [Syrrhaptes paradoxus]